ncbi:MAG: prephenate dehydrogenase [Bacillota bacterium]|nr:prephenate dehydrogenase [Bacillota bacterium]
MIQFQEIVIIGLGLMGGSLALALRKSGYSGRIIGCDLEKDTLLEAFRMGMIDAYFQDPKSAVKNADLVILAVPVGYYAELFSEIASAVKQEVIVTDLGSVKSYVEETAKEFFFDKIQFVGGHPMAGSEKGGIHAASPTLYENAYYFITPTPDTREETVEALENLVRNIGAFPVIVSAKEHDQIVAKISHLPHLVAVVLTNLLGREENVSCLPFVGGGFRDTTRIAAGNPDMWKDIFFYNKEEILLGIEDLQDILSEFGTLLSDGEEEHLLTTLEEAKVTRERVPHTGKDYIPQIFDLIIDVHDRPGALGDLTKLIGSAGLSIKQIEILHAREGEKGAIRMGFATKEEQEQAFYFLRYGGFPFSYRKGVD